VPGDLRTLLKQTLPIVLKANKQDRHGYEALVVEQAQAALKLVQGARQQAQQEALGKQNAMISPAEDAKRKSAKQQAEGKVAAAKATVENCKAALKAAEEAEEAAKGNLSTTNKETSDALRKATREADAAISAAQNEEKTASKELAHFEKKKAALDGALANEFVNLRDGTIASPAAGRSATKTLEALGKEYKLDQTLMGVFPEAAKKPADKRSEFEAMSFTNLHSLMTRVSAELSQSIGAAAPNAAAKTQAVANAEAAKAQAVANGEAAKTAAVEAAKATLESAKAATKGAEQAEEAAKEARSEASKDLTKAEAHLRHIWEDMRHACDAQDEAVQDLKNLTDEVLVAFETLKEKQPEPEPVEEPEPMELAAPEAAPEAEVPADTA